MLRAFDQALRASERGDALALAWAKETFLKQTTRGRLPKGWVRTDMAGWQIGMLIVLGFGMGQSWTLLHWWLGDEEE